MHCDSNVIVKSHFVSNYPILYINMELAYFKVSSNISDHTDALFMVKRLYTLELASTYVCIRVNKLLLLQYNFNILKHRISHVSLYKCLK